MVSRNPAELIDDIVRNVEGELKSQPQKLSHNLVPKLTGFTIDRWGDVTSISPELVQKIKNKVPPEAIAAFEDIIAKELEKSLLGMSKTKMNQFINKIIYDIVNEFQGNIYKSMIDKFEVIFTEQLEKEMKRKYPAWYVADRLDTK